MARPIYIYDKDETLKLVLENLPGNFNALSTSQKQHLLTQMAGMYLGIVGSREENELIDFERGQLPYKEGWMKDVLNGEVSLEFDVFTNHHSIAHIENKGRAVIQDKEGDYREFIIQEVEDDYSSDGAFKNVYAEGSEYELIGRWLPSYVEDSVDIRTALESIVQGTRFEVGIVEDQITHKSVELKHMSKRKAVNELLNLFNCEVKYRVKVDGNRVTRRIIDVYKKRGKDNGNMFEAGKDIIKATRLIDSKDIVTALYAVGAADENGKRLTFADVEWKVENGDPVDKPLGDTWVGDPEALKMWGDQNGTVHVQGGYDGQEEDAAELLLNAWNDLQKRINIRSTYDIDVIDLAQYMDVGIESLAVGDRTRAQVTDLQPPIEVEQSVIEYNLNLNDDKLSTCKLGHFRDRLNTEERIERVEKDWNDKRGELEKKPEKVAKDEADKVREEAQESIRQAEEKIEQAKRELEDSIDNIEVGKGDIIGLEDDLRDLRNDLGNKISTGGAASDVNRGSTKIVGSNVIIDGNTDVRGRIRAPNAVFLDVGTENMVAKHATIEHGVFTGTIDAPQATIKRATFEEVTIAGPLNSISGTFTGSVNTNEDLYVGNSIYIGDYITGDKTIDLYFGKLRGSQFGIHLIAEETVQLNSYGSKDIHLSGNVRIGNNVLREANVFVDESDGGRFKIETNNQAAQIWMDRNGTIYFLNNGSVVHKFYSNGNWWHAGRESSS